MSVARADTGLVADILWRVRELVSSYLPLLLMLLLALSTWWLVKNTPGPEAAGAARPVRHEPDYTMQGFAIQRFGPDGKLRVRIEGDRLRHYPDTDTIEIDEVRIRTLGADGRVTRATANRALANGDGSEVQLLGAAQVLSQGPGDEPPLRFDGEFLQAFLDTERMRSHLPVIVRQGENEMRADGMDYDNLTRVVRFHGKVHAVFGPAHARGAR